MNLKTDTVFLAKFRCGSGEVERYLVADTFEEALEMVKYFEGSCGQLKTISKFYASIYRKPTKTITIDI